MISYSCYFNSIWTSAHILYNIRKQKGPHFTAHH